MLMRILGSNAIDRNSADSIANLVSENENLTTLYLGMHKMLNNRIQ